jgi:glutaconyl-CoA/methylmalonyl-CoA decarboxylase subunit gamma
MKMKLKIESQYFNVEVGDTQARPIHVSVDGQEFDVWPEEETENDSEAFQDVAYEPAQQSGPSQTPPCAGETGSSVSAPIPGVILSINVKPGDKVEFGQELCVLEAMKMKNIIRANHPATIAAVHVAVGDHVKHNQPIVDYTKP